LAKAKDLTFKSKAKAKDNNTGEGKERSVRRSKKLISLTAHSYSENCSATFGKLKKRFNAF